MPRIEKRRFLDKRNSKFLGLIEKNLEMSNALNTMFNAK